MRAFKFFALGFGTALLLLVAAAFGFRWWFVTQFRADQAQWRRIPIGFVIQDDIGIPALLSQGEYSHVSPEVNAKNFPLLRNDARIANMGLFTPGQAIDTKAVLAGIKARNDGAPRPAAMDECLQYGAYIAALKSRHLFSPNRLVVCLGQRASVNGACIVPQLSSVDYGLWNLSSTACDRVWPAGVEFLVVYTRRPSIPGRR